MYIDLPEKRYYKIGEVAPDFRAETIANCMEKIIQNKKQPSNI